MYKVLHVSPVYNRDSIKQKGIIPTYVDNSYHRESFVEYDCCNEKHESVYTWVDSLKNEKFIKDLIYAKIWIQPRNEIYERIDYEIDFRYFHRRPIYRFDQMLFDIYLIETNTIGSHWYIHSQEPQPDIFNTCYSMHEKYAHDHKDTFIFKKPLKNFKIIGQALYYIDNNINIKALR